MVKKYYLGFLSHTSENSYEIKLSVVAVDKKIVLTLNVIALRQGNCRLFYHAREPMYSKGVVIV